MGCLAFSSLGNLIVVGQSVEHCHLGRRDQGIDSGNLHIVVHGRELGVVDLDVLLAVSFNGLRFGQAG